MGSNILISIIGGLSDDEYAKMAGEVIKAKKKHAPKSRGTITGGSRETISSVIQSGLKGLLEKGDD